jgi:hypothetical protein
MVDNVFSLHQITGEDEVIFPFDINQYQRYVFGDDRVAHRFGTDFAKAFITHGSGSRAAARHTTTPSDYIPTATHSLRNHFVAYLNRHLISTNANPALKIDINVVEGSLLARNGPQARTEIYQLDRDRVGDRTIIVLNDIGLGKDREQRIRASLSSLHVNNPIVFVYLASILEPSKPGSLSSILGFIISPSLKDVEGIARAGDFVMNECFVRYVLGQGEEDFCRFLRRQDDSFIRLLLDYAIGGSYYKDELYQGNVKFLQWEVGTRESL